MGLNTIAATKTSKLLNIEGEYNGSDPLVYRQSWLGQASPWPECQFYSSWQGIKSIK